MQYQQLNDLLNSYPSQTLGKYPHKYRCFNLTKHTAPLFEFLEQQSFFRFHNTNGGRLVYFHQIIAFFCCGGKLAYHNDFSCSKDIHEIHHLDGQTNNNHPSNLVYLPAEAHALITKHQKSIRKNLKRFKDGNLQPLSSWNRKGNSVKRFWDWILQILIKTINLTAKANHIDLHLKLFPKWLKQISKRLQSQVDTSYVPTFIIKTWSTI